MKVVYDGRVFTRRRAGISTFAEDFVVHFVKYNSECDFIIITPKKFDDTFKDLENNKKIKIQVCPLLFDVMPKIIWFFFYSSFIVNRLKADVYISPITQYPFFLSKRIKFILTVHDLVNKEFASTMNWKNRVANFFTFDFSIFRSKNIWCNSEYTQKKLLEYFPKKNNANFFVGLTVPDYYKQIIISESEKQLVLSKYNLNRPFLLFVGSLEPRKNIPFLLLLAPKIFESLNYQILIIGASKWKFKLSSEDLEKLGDSVVFVSHFVSNEDLVLLYNVAECYISTSFNEGFGMPQLEALKCGCHVVSPHNSAMIEVVSSNGTLVEGWNSNDWVDKIKEEICCRREISIPDKYNWSYIIKNFMTFIQND